MALMDRIESIHADADRNSVTKATTVAGGDASKAKHSIEQIERISARAYAKWRQRAGSAPGDPDRDWLEAEREIDSATSCNRW